MAHDPRHEPLRAFLATQRDQLIRLDALLKKATTPHELAWVLADFAGRVLALDDCVVYLAQPDGAHLLQYAAYGTKQVAERIFENRIALPFGHGIVGACARMAQAQLIADTLEDPRYVVDDVARRAELAVPILDRGHVLGVIDSEHPEPGFYTQAHVEALRAVAAQAAKRLRVLDATGADR